MEISRSALDKSCEIANLNHLSRIYIAEKNYAEAGNYSQRALVLARQIGERLGEAHALATLGYSEVIYAQELEVVESDVYERAIEYLQRGIKLSERINEDPLSNGFAFRQSQALCYNCLGIAYIALENYQTAIESLEKGIQAAQLAGDRYLSGLNFVYLAEAYYKLQEMEKVVCNGCLGMYLLEQISASEWRQPALLLTSMQYQIGVEAFTELLAQSREDIMKIIGFDGYDYLPQLLEKYKKSL